MRRFFRGISTFPVCTGTSFSTPKRIPKSSTDTDERRPPNNKVPECQASFDLSDVKVTPASSEPFYCDNICVTKTGCFVTRSFLVDRQGQRLGENRCHTFVISPCGMVLLEEKDGVRVYPDLERVVGVKEAERIESGIEASRRALNLAFKKKSRAESRLERQSHVLSTLELELVQVMKDIKNTSRHLKIISRTTDRTKAEVATLLQHEMAKIDVDLRRDEPEMLEKYDGLKSSKETTAFKTAIQKKIHNLEKIRELARHKYFIQKSEEKEGTKAKSSPEARPKRKIRRKKEKVLGSAPRGLREELVAGLIRVSDDRRSGAIKQTLETEL